MIVSDWSVKNRVVVVVFCVAVTAAGVMAYRALPLEAFPEITIPYMLITTNYKGVAPVDVERSITVKIEEELKGLPDVRHITSTSSEGSSLIVVEFEPDIDVADALQKVKDRVDRAKNELPGDLEDDPAVKELSSSEFPIVSVVLSGPIGLPRLKDIAEGYKDAFEAIPGVVEAEISGGLEREIIVAVDLERAVGYGLPITQVGSQITSENLSVSGGTMRMGAGRYQIRVPGEFETPGEAQKLVVAVMNGEPVYLDDVAVVTDGFKEEMSRSRMNTLSAVSIGVKKRTGHNVVKVVDEVDKVMARRAAQLPSGVTAMKVGDLAKFVKSLVKDLENNLASGFVLVLVVVFFSMGFRNALLVSVSIPLSMLMAFVVLDAMGVTLNMIVLFSMTLALGMLVDSAIVIIENIYRFMQAGVPRVRAACRATAEVAWPIIGSMLTTIVAFTPLLFWPGIMGSVFKYLPITVITILTSCLLVALVVNPALAAIFMKRPPRARSLSAGEVEKAGEAPVAATTGVLGLYRRSLVWCLRHRAIVLVSATLVVVLSVQTWLLVIGLEKPISLMPAVDADNVHVQIDPPEGAGLEYNDAIVREVEERIRGAGGRDGKPSDFPDIEHFLAKCSLGTGGFKFGPGSGSPNIVTAAFVGMEERERPTSETANDIRERMKGIPGAEISVIEEKKGPPTGAAVNLEITGEDLETLGRIAALAKVEVEKVPFVYDVRDDYVVGVPTVRVRVDRKKAALVGLNTELVGLALKFAFNGLQVSTYRQGGEDYDITVRLPDEQRDAIDTLERFFIPTTACELVPLTSIADIVYEGGYASINRKDHQRTVTITAQIDEAKTTGDNARRDAERNIADLRAELARKAPGYETRFTGELEFQKDTEEFLARAFLIALFAIAIILITIFNSVTQPFIIMTCVLLSAATAFLGLAVKQLPFVLIMSGIGLISLAGVVVNNAIVLVDYTNKLRERGYGLEEAVLGAGATRLRPVVLTATTTILGLVPLVTGIAFDFRKFRFASASESSQWWTPMAICVIFGLALATFLTLLVVPCLYHLIESLKQRAGLARGPGSEPQDAPPGAQAGLAVADGE